MFNLDWIKAKISSGEYEYSAHADEEREAEKILISDIEDAILKGEILENYPDDLRGHSCLILGYGKEGCPIHTVCGKTISEKLRIITVYIPLLPKWIDERTRRR